MIESIRNGEYDTVKIGTKFSKSMLDKIVNKLIEKKLGKDLVNVFFNSLNIGTTEEDGIYTVHAEVVANVNKEVIKKLIWSD